MPNKYGTQLAALGGRKEPTIKPPPNAPIFLKDKKFQSNISEAISSKVYNKEKVLGYNDVELTVNKCNLFVDDVAKKFGVTLPRHPEANPGSMWKGWPERPLRVRFMAPFLRGLTIYSKSGVKQVDRFMAHDLANKGALVITTLNGVHSSIMAPGTKRPSIYRSDLANRKGDKRQKVGISDAAEFFAVNPQQYTEFNAKGRQGNSVEAVINFGKGVRDYQKLGEED